MDKTQITEQAKRLASGVVDPATFRPSRATLKADFMAGLTFALVNIPQSMGHALLANVNPTQGLFTLVIGMPVAALFTSSVFMNVSTTSALAVAAGESLRSVAAPDRAVYLTTLILLAGLFQFIAGLLRLGTLMRFISNSVMLGFTTGVAILIILGQTQDITGYDSAFSNKVLVLADITLHLPQIDWPTLLVGVLTIALILGFGYTPLRRFAPIAGMAAISFLVWLVQPASVRLVGDTLEAGGLSFGFVWPSLALMPALIWTALAVAIIGLVQGAGVSQSYANPDGKYPNSSRDFWGQGLANMAVSFLQGIPAGGSMSGTALMVSSGAQSRLANIMGGLLVAPIALFLGGMISLIPMSALAGLLILVGYQSLKPEAIRVVWQTGYFQRVAFGITLLTTLILPLQYAVFIGIAVSAMLYVFRASNQIKLMAWELMPEGFPLEKAPPATLPSHEVTLLYPYGSLFFGAAPILEKQLPEVGDSDQAVVILGLRGQDELGSTFINVLHRYADALGARGGRLMLVGTSPQVYGQLARTGLLQTIGTDSVFRAEAQLGAALNQALIAARAWLAQPPA